MCSTFSSIVTDLWLCLSVKPRLEQLRLAFQGPHELIINQSHLPYIQIRYLFPVFDSVH